MYSVGMVVVEQLTSNKLADFSYLCSVDQSRLGDLQS